MLSPAQDDPIHSDPSPVDWDYPPSIVTITPTSQGDALNGIIYIANGPGPHPTLLMLHGYPGDEKNLDLAQAVRRAGWNVAFFHYRGAWGSSGIFSVQHALEDVGAVLDYLRLPNSQRGFRIDASRIVLFGHSLGAYLALLAAPGQPDIRHLAIMAPVNLGHVMATMDPDGRASFADALEAMGHGAIRGAGAAAFASLGDDLARYDVMQNIAGFDGRNLLFIIGERDEDTPPAYHCLPIVKALQERSKSTVALAALDADHLFSSARVALARLVIQWLASTLHE